MALSYHTRMEQLDFRGLNTDYDSHSLSTINLNYASVVYPFNLSDINMVLSLNYQRLYEFDRDLEYTVKGYDTNGDRYWETRRLEQAGALTTTTPAFCIQLLPELSVHRLQSAGDRVQFTQDLVQAALVDPGVVANAGQLLLVPFQLLDQVALDIGTPEDGHHVNQAADCGPAVPGALLGSMEIHLLEQVFQAQEGAGPFVQGVLIDYFVGCSRLHRVCVTWWRSESSRQAGAVCSGAIIRNSPVERFQVESLRYFWCNCST